MLRPASGTRPAESDVVLVNYIGYLAATGTVFDQGMQSAFPVNGVISGFSKGLQLIAKTGVARFAFRRPWAMARENQDPSPPTPTWYSRWSCSTTRPPPRWKAWPRHRGRTLRGTRSLLRSRSSGGPVASAAPRRCDVALHIVAEHVQRHVAAIHHPDQHKGYRSGGTINEHERGFSTARLTLTDDVRCLHHGKSATDIIQDVINAAVVDAIVALKEASKGLPNVAAPRPKCHPLQH